jgi:DNA-binding NarL/FixJ family response regulator
MLKVLVVDDHPFVHRGLQHILNEAFDSLVMGEALNSEQAWAQACLGEWDLVILDITMPGKNGLQLLPELKRRWPKLPVIMFSLHYGQVYIDMSFRAGASGYLLKEAAPDELIEAVRTVLGGGAYLSQSLRPSAP